MTQKLYDTLGVGDAASKDEIKRAYKRLAMRHHPDKDGGDADRFKEISEAYGVLSDDDQRSKYDHPEREPVIDNMSHMFDHGFASMFMGMNMGGMGHMGHGQGHGHMHGQGQASGTKRPNHTFTLNLTLADVFSGVQKTLKVNVPLPCLTCVKTCTSCNGTGVMRHTTTNGMMRQVVTMACSSCGGKGRNSDGSFVCPECSNTRVKNNEHILTIDVPKGEHSGRRECFKGLGEQAVATCDVSGDLIVELCVLDDPNFVRKGDDLLMNVSLSLWESLIGKAFVVPMFGGELKLNTHDIDTGIMQPGKGYGLTGFGMPLCRGPMNARGALILNFSVSYPSSRMSEDQHKRLKDFCSRSQ